MMFRKWNRLHENTMEAKMKIIMMAPKNTHKNMASKNKITVTNKQSPFLL